MTKRLLIFGLMLVSLFFFGAVVSAQETDGEIAAKHRVTFPIPELGGCASLSECKTFCDDPVNREACISFAKEKGFYKKEEFEPNQGMMTKAKAILGCSSISSCREFCEKGGNFDRCHSFAKSAGLVGGYAKDPESEKFLSKAKEALGCDSHEACRNFCENPDNRDKCSQFAAKIGARGGNEHRGPGGCTTQETCKDFCSNPGNVEICRNFSEGHGGKFRGPGGCSDEASCRDYCEKNPQSCGGGDFKRDYDPAEMCGRTPNCSWTENSCKCKEREILHTEGDRTPYPYPTGHDQLGPVNYATPYSQPSYDPATECAKTSGCSWNGSSCQCGSSGSSPDLIKTTEPQPSAEPQPSGEKTMGPTTVQGAATVLVKTWWQKLLSLLE